MDISIGIVATVIPKLSSAMGNGFFVIQHELLMMTRVEGTVRIDAFFILVIRFHHISMPAIASSSSA